MAFGKEKLKKRFSVGKEWEAEITVRLIDAGIPAKMGCTGWIEGADPLKMSKEDKDIVVNDSIVLEVKSRAGTCSSFTGPEDYPYDTAIVETVYGWKAKNEKPAYYVMVAQGSGGVVVVDGADQENWLEAVFYDRYEGKRNKTFVAKKTDLKSWDWLIERLKEDMSNASSVQAEELSIAV